MRDLTLTIPSGIANRKTKNSVSVKTWNLSILSAIIVFGLVYFFAVTAMATKGYEIKKLETRLVQLEQDQKNLQVEASNLQSIDLIQMQAQKLDFVPSTGVTYLKNSDYALK